MDVAHAAHMLGEHRGGGMNVICGKAHVPAVEEEPYFIADQRHESIDIGRRFDI